MYNIPFNLIASAFIIAREGSSVNDERVLLVERFKHGRSQFFIGRSVYAMKPVIPSFVSNNVCQFSQVFPGLLFYTHQIPVNSLISNASGNYSAPS